ncbi:transport-associated protein (plasmid) [Rhizobium leguminosarum]|uniref:Transport-associated protein n=1 Tax=Rhizobium leguminosarum TaxID=384 RepID=A0A1B1CIZ3_RHILE|nr:BON domain-containing protein [Rhizobium leguminosarum]ANP89724.1 transport-associated protein [Rhizobium leguminosarum]
MTKPSDRPGLPSRPPRLSGVAHLEAAISADSNLDSGAIEIRMLGPVVLLEGYITSALDREKAISVAAMIVGPENVHDRMPSRFPTQ